MWIPRQWFKWEESQWYPYYKNSEFVSIGGDEVYGSFHVNSGKQVLFYMMNMSTKGQTVEVQLNVEKLGLPEKFYVKDAVTSEEFVVSGGKFSISILGERPRVLMMAPEPVNLPLQKEK